jgi:formylglycine-generating enzyme required for sulfatase activity
VHYAAGPAGTRTEYSFGDDHTELMEYGWLFPDVDSNYEVATLRANAWGLHDLHGGVWEWCEDTWHPGYEEAPGDGSAWTEGGTNLGGEILRVIRGGASYHPQGDGRSADRSACPQGWQRRGFRPAMTASDDADE